TTSPGISDRDTVIIGRDGFVVSETSDAIRGLDFSRLNIAVDGFVIGEDQGIFVDDFLVPNDAPTTRFAINVSETGVVRVNRPQ
ncbi:MAG: hypothetical protein AAFV51_10575, partial [Pseudomonadota bacterium]